MSADKYLDENGDPFRLSLSELNQLRTLLGNLNTWHGLPLYSVSLFDYIDGLIVEEGEQE